MEQAKVVLILAFCFVSHVPTIRCHGVVYQGIMLVYDVTKERTFTNVSKWLRNIEENAVDNVRIVLVGNKIDLENQREVSEKRGKKLADQHGVQFFETSAWANRHVTQPFDSLASQIMEDMTQKVQVERNGTIKLGYGQSINDVRPA
ncbi:Ras-related protein Rab-10, partial [Geodia barretti]